MKNKMAKYFLFLGMISCKYEKNMSPEVKCQAEVLNVVSYKNNIQKILNDNCNNCHSNRNHSGGIALEDFEDVKFWANNGSINEQIVSVNGATPKMPRGSIMSDCDVKIIQKWLSQGALQN